MKNDDFEIINKEEQPDLSYTNELVNDKQIMSNEYTFKCKECYCDKSQDSYTFWSFLSEICKLSSCGKQNHN